MGAEPAPSHGERGPGAPLPPLRAALRSRPVPESIPNAADSWGAQSVKPAAERTKQSRDPLCAPARESTATGPRSYSRNVASREKLA